MKLYTIEQRRAAPDGNWEPTRDSAGIPLAYVTRKGAQNAIRHLPQHAKGTLVYYRIIAVKD